MKKVIFLLSIGTMVNPMTGEVYVESGGAYISTRDGKAYTRPDKDTPALIDQQTGQTKSPIVIPR